MEGPAAAAPEGRRGPARPPGGRLRARASHLLCPRPAAAGLGDRVCGQMPSSLGKRALRPPAGLRVGGRPEGAQLEGRAAVQAAGSGGHCRVPSPRSRDGPGGCAGRGRPAEPFGGVGSTRRLWLHRRREGSCSREALGGGLTGRNPLCERLCHRDPGDERGEGVRCGPDGHGGGASIQLARQQAAGIAEITCGSRTAQGFT